jgi:S-adenosylmethionine:tRNA ribosyltransferase-isomerase
MLTSDFDFHLPENLIAQEPASPRDHSRLMILNREKQSIEHKYFYDLIDLLTENDVLVFNNTKVINARLFAHPKSETKSNPYEIFLIKEIEKNIWEVLVNPGKKFQTENEFTLLEKDKKTPSDISVIVTKINEDGTRNIKFYKQNSQFLNINSQFLKFGHIPLPPYINSNVPKEKENFFEKRYQTVYANNQKKGSIAAPTAGLHFTNALLKKIKAKNIQIEFVNLHVGLGTFLPVKTEDVSKHQMHSEFFSLTHDTANNLNKAKKFGKKIVAVGTTTVRVLESSSKNGILNPQIGETSIFITPGYKFEFVDKLISNFHLPKSTLIMLVSAFAGKDFIFESYKEAILKKYRFYSFGDAMFIK